MIQSIAAWLRHRDIERNACDLIRAAMTPTSGWTKETGTERRGQLPISNTILRNRKTGIAAKRRSMGPLIWPQYHMMLDDGCWMDVPDGPQLKTFIKTFQQLEKAIDADRLMAMQDSFDTRLAQHILRHSRRFDRDLGGLPAWRETAPAIASAEMLPRGNAPSPGNDEIMTGKCK